MVQENKAKFSTNSYKELLVVMFVGFFSFAFRLKQLNLAWTNLTKDTILQVIFSIAS